MLRRNSQDIGRKESIQMEDSLDFTGKAVIVTGGGKGIGRGISECFLAAGARVLICGRSQPQEIPQSDGNSALFIACDVRDIEQIEACVNYAVAQFGRLDVLVNNAGGAPHAHAATVSPRFSESVPDYRAGQPIGHVKYDRLDRTTRRLDQRLS